MGHYMSKKPQNNNNNKNISSALKVVQMYKRRWLLEGDQAKSKSDKIFKFHGCDLITSDTFMLQ